MSVNPKSHKCSVKGIYELAKANKYPGAVDDYVNQLVDNINNGVDLNTSTISDYINLSNYNDSESILVTVDALTRTLKEKLYNRTVVTHQMTNEKAQKLLTQTISSLADLTGESRDSLLSRVVRDINNLQEAAIDTVLLKGVIEAISNEIYTTAKTVDVLNPESIQRFEALEDAFMKLIPADRLLGEGSGRLLNVRKAVSTQVKDTAEIITKYSNPIERAQQYAMAQNRQGVMKLLRGGLDAALTYRVNAMLSSPMTWGLVNNFSNAYKTLVTPAERIIGGGATFQPKEIRQGLAMYHGLLSSIGDAWSMAGTVLKTNSPILRGTTSTIEASSKQDISAENFGLDPASILGRGVNWLGNIVGIPSRLLMTSDEFWLQMNYRGRLKTELHQKAFEAGLQPGSKEYLDFIETRFNESFTPKGLAADDNALLYATQQSYSQQLNTNQTWVSDIGSWAQSGQNHKKEAVRVISHVLTPFVRTPVNILEDVIQHTPAAFLEGKLYRDLAAGGERRAMAVGKLATGSTFLGMGVAAAMSGVLTGGGPRNEKARRDMEAMGWKPYSLVIPTPDGSKNYIPLSRFDPIGTYLATAADLFETFEHASAGEVDLAYKQLTASIFSQMENKTFLQGLVDAGTMLSKLTKGEFDGKFFNSFVGSWVPSIVKDIRNDPYLREVRSVVDALRARTPGLAQGLPPRLNIFGEPELPLTLNLWAKQDNSPATQAMIDLADKGVDWSPLPKALGSVNLVGFKNAEGKTAYDRFGEILAETKYNGQTLKDKLNEAVSAPNYKDLSDPYQQGDGSYTGGKAERLRSIINGYRRFALHTLEQEEFRNHEGRTLMQAIFLDKAAAAARTQEQAKLVKEMEADTDEAPLQDPQLRQLLDDLEN